ncbi:MAG: DUF4252 domain-containing protein [Cyclobacteriaceae bacterium]
MNWISRRWLGLSVALVLLALIVCPAQAQTKTTTALHERYSEALSLYFYKNTLRMMNQTENKEFDEIIEDIEKMKFLMIDKTKDTFESSDYQELTAGYKEESYEEIMTSRYEGKKFDIYLREKSGETKGMVVLANDSSSLYVLDILGKVELSKVTKLFTTIDNSAEIGKMIKAFTDDGDRRGRGSRHEN